MFMLLSTHKKILSMKEKELAGERALLTRKEELFIKTREVFERENFQALEKRLIEKYSTAIEALKIEHAEKLESVREEYRKKHESRLEENFVHLQNSLRKIHEEGNAVTKAVKEFALVSLGKIPTIESKGQ